MRVLIADKVEDFVRARLEQGGFEVVWEPTVHGDTLREALSLHDPQVVLVRSTKVQVEHFTAGEGIVQSRLDDLR